MPGIDGTRVRVVGIAHNGVPVLGLTYIVELLEPLIGNYAYTHCVAFEAHLR